jgi:hypothetical protein
MAIGGDLMARLRLIEQPERIDVSLLGKDGHFGKLSA